MTARAVFVASLLSGAPAAHAWEVVAQVTIRVTVEVSSRITFEASSEASSASSRTSKSNSPEEEEEDQKQSAARPRACSTDEVCEDDQRCVSGECQPATEPTPVPVTEPADAQEKPPAMLWRRGSEVYLRGHASQLRQDVALGEGPVLAALSSLERVPPATLGRLMRAHHRELLELISDGDEWPRRFLDRVSDLARPAVTRAAAAPSRRGS